MCRDIYEAFPSARDVFEEADYALEMNLTRTIFDGPEEELRLTETTQPAIMTASIAVLRALEREMGVRVAPVCGAGHSLGEYTALVAAGSIAFQDAVSLVKKRGAWMQEATPEGTGCMVALMGIEPEDVIAACSEVAPNMECQVANFNSPGQTVISGITEFVDKAVAMAAKKGGSRVKSVTLNVSAPFHSRLMMPAAIKLRDEFERCRWKPAVWPVISNAEAAPVSSVDDIKRALFEQTYSPVRWVETVGKMADGFGVGVFLELGPGNVLSSLNKRCRKGITVMSADAPDKLEAIAKLIEKGEA
jgi:[acyl-carrier-protein] S-malonyltransferase